MNKIALILIHVVCAVVLVSAACTNAPKSKLQGEWKVKDGKTGLKITTNQFTMLSDSPEPEDYFIKDDTIFTSFQGSIPYSKFVVKQLDEHRLNIMGPDSVLLAYDR